MHEASYNILLGALGRRSQVVVSMAIPVAALSIEANELAFALAAILVQ